MEEEKTVTMDKADLLLESIDGLTESLKETREKANAKMGEVITGEEAEAEKAANMEEVAGLSKIMNMEVMNVPVGQAAIGGAMAIFLTELIDGFLVTQSVQMKGVAKLVGAGATVMFGKKLLGKAGVTTVALLMTFDALRDLTPIDAWAKSWAAALSGVLPTGGLADVSDRRGNPSVQQQVNRVASDYYAKALGGR